MTVIKTKEWLYKIIELSKKSSGRSLDDVQCEIICNPLLFHFEDVPKEALHYELLRNGLFTPDECMGLEKVVKEMERQNVWRIVSEEYKILRELWEGPEVNIYIFPISKNIEMNSEEPVPNKNGIAFKNAVFLFVSTELPPEEIKAMLAHEYNHVCRLGYLQLPPTQISLQDSLIVEGLGEYAVKELYGEKWLAPWVNMYTLEEMLVIWKQYFMPALKIKGVIHHHPFMYGEINGTLPKWIGYAIGYHIVDTFRKNQASCDFKELCIKSADEIIKESYFKML